MELVKRMNFVTQGGKVKKYPLRMESEQSELRGSKSMKKKILSCPTMKG